GEIACESGRPPRHVCREDGRGRPQPHRPPGAPMAGDVTGMSPAPSGDAQEPLDSPPFLATKPVEVLGEIDDGAQLAGIFEQPPGRNQFASLGDTSIKNALRELARVLTGDPHSICARHLAAVNSAELPKLDKTVSAFASRMSQT